ncbi:IMPACT family protein [Bifidobacterium aquikefiri]|uniref:IMPACT family protein n=1 Tax=Bifidobacterium aquikefiri TaxID=1653207 RepID=UPI0023EF6039|nr:YigZ family protein [Bifidobacterium aquikefiri]
MHDSLTILNTQETAAHGIVEEKRSRFIADACHIDQVNDAVEFVARIRLQHPKARHIAFAALYLDANDVAAERMSDDGEPAGTAGKPILELLRHRSVADCAITVTRYFGGVLLGAGGLTRAYASAAATALDVAQYGKTIVCARFKLIISYSQLSLCKRAIALNNGSIVDTQYTQNVVLIADIPAVHARSFKTRIVDGLSGDIQLHEEGLQRSILALSH